MRGPNRLNAHCCFCTSHRAQAYPRFDRSPEAQEQAPENPIPPPPAQRLNATKNGHFYLREYSRLSPKKHSGVSGNLVIEEPPVFAVGGG
jgi:hypothetical protein